jgi:hypothetical protein
MQDAPERLIEGVAAAEQDYNDLPVNPMSWFGIASIHGQPYVTWDNAPHFAFKADTEKTKPRGYCRHGSTLFPTWHRAYLALFEVGCSTGLLTELSLLTLLHIQQALHSEAQRIVEKYATCSDSAQWKEAARTLRAPYWDWCKNPHPPREVYDVESYSEDEPTLEVLVVDDHETSATVRKDRPNPLLWYQFKVTPRWAVNLVDRNLPDEPLEWDLRRTLRHTRKNTVGSPVSNPVNFEV